MKSRSTFNRGFWLGALAVVIFSMTFPMTRLAVGTTEAPQMSGIFVALGRAVVAAGLSAVLLTVMRAPLPKRKDWGPLGTTACGVVIGFPLFTSVALRSVEVVHASVIAGVLPLATAAVGALLHRQRPSYGFWLCAAFGSALVIAFSIFRASSTTGHFLSLADLLLLAGMLCAAIGYGYGARLAQHMRAEHVICWALVISLPLTLPLTLLNWPPSPVKASAWWAFFYVAAFSMWLGMIVWYRGLMLGGTVRVSQVQLLQPFLSMIFAVPLLGERLDTVSVGFAFAVIATVFIGKRIPILSTNNTGQSNTTRSNLESI